MYVRAVMIGTYKLDRLNLHLVDKYNQLPFPYSTSTSYSTMIHRYALLCVASLAYANLTNRILDDSPFKS